MSHRHFFFRWLGATAVGWLLGFVSVIGIAMVFEMNGTQAQFMVGTGMGFWVGFMQRRAIRQWTGSSPRWWWASVIGMGAPFAAWDLGTLIGIGSFFSLALCVAIGGLLAGLLQRRLLASQSDQAIWWVIASVLGWSLSAAAIALGDAVGGAMGGIISISAMLFGGLILGCVTGGFLIWNLQLTAGNA